MIGSLFDPNKASLSITNSYHIGNISNTDTNQKCGLLFGVMNFDSSNVQFRNVYGMGKLTNCESITKGSIW